MNKGKFTKFDLNPKEGSNCSHVMRMRVESRIESNIRVLSVLNEHDKKHLVAVLVKPFPATAIWLGKLIKWMLCCDMIDY